MSGWIFGIDGGGTRSRIRAESLAGEGLLEAVAAGTNPNTRSSEAIVDTLRGLVGEVLASGADPRECRAGFIGSAGVDRATDREAMAGLLSRAFRAAAGWNRSEPESPVLSAGNDAEPALVGALDDVEGFLLIAGTGSIAYGRSRAGRCVRAGGWGHFLGDEGSAFWIAFEGIKRGIRSTEGREAPSGLAAAAVEHFGLDDVYDLIPFTYGRFDKARVASFAPRVTALAAEGDAPAAAIAGQAALELAALVTSVYRRIGPGIGGKRLAFYGGLIEQDEALRTAVTERLWADIPELEIVRAKGDAQSGACRLARELLR